MQMENKKRMPQQAPQAKADKAPAEQDTALVWGKNPVTELLKSEAGVDTLLLADSMEPRMAGYYTALGKAAGAAARIPVARVANLPQAIRDLKKQNIFVYCADLGGAPLEKTDLSGPVALVLGSEGAGPGALVRKLCDAAVTLDMAGGKTGVDSYNVSVAAGILMYNIMQRRK